jgi:hypothetical protein
MTKQEKGISPLRRDQPSAGARPEGAAHKSDVSPFPVADLELYLDEALPAEEMARIEQALRTDRRWAERLVAINARRDSGVHSLGEIWRRHRLSCPTRQQLGSYLLGTLAREWHHYVLFHLETVGCRYCQANLADLKRQQAESFEAVQTRRRKYFQSSAGYLRRSDR